MNKLSKVAMAAVAVITAFTAQAGNKMNQAEMKLGAMQLCTKAASDTYGEKSIVSVRKKVEWQRDTSRRLWNDGLRANIRMVIWLDEEHLARVMCEVDQQQRILLTAVKVFPSEESGLFAASQVMGEGQ